MSRKILARASANIAIVKYMGKADARLNLPANASLSMTLDSLCTVVELREASTNAWVPEVPAVRLPGLLVPTLDERGVKKFEAHFERVLSEAPAILRAAGVQPQPPESWVIRSANTFPAASGIASSASAFAALTLAGAAACAENIADLEAALERGPVLRRALARLSRRGSGSSCRSFEGPWVRWSGEEARGVFSSLGRYVDLVLLVASVRKDVSSSDAHEAVTSSPLWSGRAERANARVRDLEEALASGAPSRLARIAWEESWEMHSLFHTSSHPFSYWLPQSLELLQWLRPGVEEGLALRSSDVPVVTMDAGPNVHLLVPEAHAARWRARVAERFPGLAVLEDRAGSGARLISER